MSPPPTSKRTRQPARAAPPARTAAEKRRAQTLVRALRRLHPDARCALHHRNAFELLVATVLSAQCTDERVNQVTPALFRRFPTPRDLAAAAPGELERLIRPTGFYRAKARTLRALAGELVARHGGRVPARMDALVELPGVARKTANVVLGVAMGKAEGIVVDTHVRRVAGRLGLTAHQDPVKIEQDLMGLFPRRQWIDLGHLLIFHGRRLCTARRPRCEACALARWCPSAAGPGGERGHGPQKQKRKNPKQA